MFTETDARLFTDAYIETLVWSGPEECEDGTVSDALRMRADVECRAFLYRVACFIDAEPTSPGMAQAGHDFALTRNGHGAGFWDGDWPVYGNMLTKVSKAFGEIYIGLSEEGEIVC